MKPLTNYQKEFFLECFFKNEKYSGWKEIATKLLETGQCIVAGDKCIWYGGIGNFIKTETAKDAFDCLLYKFDFDYFLTSEWYKQIAKEYLNILYEKKIEAEKKYQEIFSIYTF